MDYTPTPTVVPAAPFDASADAQALRAAMKGFGTDEDEIINILTARTNAQRQQIKAQFETELGRDLIKDLKSELGGKFEDVILALMTPPVEYLCKQLHNAMAGMGTDEETLVEILCTKTNEEMHEIVAAYEAIYDRPLAEQMCSETSGFFRRLLTLIVTGVRDPAGTVDAIKAHEDAEALYAAGEAMLGTDEAVFNRIMSHSSFAQLRLIFDEYKELSGQTIEQAIKHEMSGALHDAMMAIVECVQSQAAFFANRLYNAMKGMGTNDDTLIRIIVSRSEIDLANIKDEFERIYNRTLYSAVVSETSGDYKKALTALLGGA
ncbi:annexin B10-like [Bactrocera neohumeralis]|uniref:annexin B10-like n=1 Tax=Bactrocera tryoni TaxID=59916 RepID=UPI001A9A1FFB|nr:annexin B10-like [Bactrocera tryoni]XP_050331849.1 annexin B10-like [Bactrocera neohumeralis]